MKKKFNIFLVAILIVCFSALPISGMNNVRAQGNSPSVLPPGVSADGIALDYSASASQLFTFTIPSIIPKAGYWKSPAGVRFYVNPAKTRVLKFTIASISACGYLWTVTHLPTLLISNKTFSFTGPFYGNGTFHSTSTVTGIAGLKRFLLKKGSCSVYVTKSVWYSAKWINTSQP